MKEFTLNVTRFSWRPTMKNQALFKTCLLEKKGHIKNTICLMVKISIDDIY